MSDFMLWLQGLGLEKYSAVLVGHDIDLTVVPDLTEQDLEKLGLSLGHRRKFLAAAGKFRPVAASSPVSAAPVQLSPQPTALNMDSRSSLERKFLNFAVPVVGKAGAERVMSLVDGPRRAEGCPGIDPSSPWKWKAKSGVSLHSTPNVPSGLVSRC